MPQVIWTPQAESELEEILFHIRVQDGRPVTARRIGQEYYDLAEQSAGRPAGGHQHPHAPDGWLYFQHKRWLVFYRQHQTGIEVMRVVDGARDLPRRLGD